MTRTRSRGPLAPLLAACLLGNPALAQTESRGFHATLYAQASRLGTTGLGATGVPGLGPGLQARFDPGTGLGGDIGYRYGNGWSAEFEWNYRRHGLKSLRNATARLASDGDFASNILFINGLRRFPSPASPWTPYVGAGLGWVQEIDLDITRAGQETSFSKSGRLGLQLIGGVAFALSPVWSLTGDLRWLRVGGVELSTEERPAGRLGQPRYNPVSVQVGIRRHF